MAIKRTLKLNNGLGEFIEHFICDKVTDLDELPGLEEGTISGSTVLCLENKTKYMLSVAGEWKEAPAEGISKEALLAILEDKADLVNGLVPGAQLPSFVDDVLEFDSLTDFPEPGEEGKIYVAIDTNKTYRWSGSTYIPLTPDEIDGNLTKIKLKRKLESELPILDVGELGFTIDKENVYIGADGGNKRIDKDDIRVGVVPNLLTNISGLPLTPNYSIDTSHLEEQYPYVVVLDQGENPTKERAKQYLEYLLGSTYLPIFDYECPSNPYIVDGDGNLWKPQWTDVGEDVFELRLYLLNRIVLSPSLPTEGDILVFKDGVWKPTDEIYVHSLTAGDSNTGAKLGNATISFRADGLIGVSLGTDIYIGGDSGLVSDSGSLVTIEHNQDGDGYVYHYGNSALKVVDEQDGMPIIDVNDELQLGRVNKDDKVGLWARDKELISYDDNEDKIVIANKITIIDGNDVYLDPNTYFRLGTVMFAVDEHITMNMGDGLFDINDGAIATYKNDTQEYFYGGGAITKGFDDIKGYDYINLDTLQINVNYISNISTPENRIYIGDDIVEIDAFGGIETINLRSADTILLSASNININGALYSFDGNPININSPLRLLNIDTLYRPVVNEIGSVIFDTDLGLPIVWNGTKWIKFDGSDA